MTTPRVWHSITHNVRNCWCVKIILLFNVYYAQNNSRAYEIMLTNEILTLLCLYLHHWSVESGERPKMQGSNVGKLMEAGGRLLIAFADYAPATDHSIYSVWIWNFSLVLKSCRNNMRRCIHPTKRHHHQSQLPRCIQQPSILYLPSQNPQCQIRHILLHRLHNWNLQRQSWVWCWWQSWFQYCPGSLWRQLDWSDGFAGTSDIGWKSELVLVLYWQEHPA